MQRKRFSMLQWLAVIALIVGLLPMGITTAADDDLDTTALLHDSRSDLYRTPGGAVTVETPVILRFRTAAGNVDSVSVRVYSTRDEAQTLVPMSVVATTPDGYDLWEATIDPGRQTTVLWYRFLVSKGDTTVYYEDDTRPDGGTGNFQAHYEGGPGAVYENSPDLSWQITVYDPAFYTPEWMRNAVIYQIFPDRFRNGDTTNDPEDGSDVFYGSLPLLFHETWNEAPVDGRTTVAPDGTGYYNSDFFGGDLAGIIEKLDYLQELGVTAIYLNPIFEARSNHRYDTADFLAIDPMLGDLDTFRTLVDEAEQRGMVLILDGVFNHLSSDSYFFDRYHRFEGDEGACESLQSPWRDWFFWVQPRGTQPDACIETPNGETYYTSWAGFDSIPKIDSAQLGPREYIFLDEDSVAQFWGREGIGGWRLDVAGDIDPGGPGTIYWEAFRSVLRSINPESVIIGEEWADASGWLLGKEWDSTMNYRLRTGIIGFVRDEDFMDNDANGDRIIYALMPSEVNTIIHAIEEDYPPQAYHAMMNLLDSHDTTRLFFAVGNDVQRQKLAALLQFSLPGAPTVYYGDEISIDAPSIPDTGGNLQDDPYNRAPYPWPDTEGDTYPAPNEDTLAFYQQIAALRHANSALREGEMITLLTDDASGVFAFLRLDEAAGNAALVVLNNSAEAQTAEFDLAGLVPDGLTLTPAFEADAPTTGEGSLSVQVDAHSGNVWTVTADASFAGPTAPANLTAEGVSGSVSLAWDAVEGASGYLVYRSPVAQGGFELVTDAPLTGASYVDESITDGFRYFYRVAAVGADGLGGARSDAALAIPSAVVESVFYVGDDVDEGGLSYEPLDLALTVGVSHEITAAIRIPGATEAEGPVTGVRAEATLFPADADLGAAEWVPMTYRGEVNGADAYTASLAPQSAGTYQAIARFSVNAGESWTVVTFQDDSLPLVVVAPSTDLTAPAAPAEVRVTRASLSGVVVEWNAPADDDLYAYRVYRAEDEGEVEQLGEVLAGEDTRYTDRNVVAGASYVYTITAVDSSLNESEAGVSPAVEPQRLMVPTTFNVTVPDYTEGDVYLAGSFGTSDYPSWDPAGIPMTAVDDTHWTVTLELPEGANIEYKFARASWDAVEKDAECQEIANRRLSITVEEGMDSLTVEDVVEKWRDLDSCG